MWSMRLSKAMDKMMLRMSYGSWKKRHAGVSIELGVIGRREEGRNGASSGDGGLGLDSMRRYFFSHALSLDMVGNAAGGWP